MLAVADTSKAEASNDLQLDDLAALNKAAADPLRLRILLLLQQDSFGVLEIAEIFAISQSRLSHHLKILAKANLVSTRREGNSIFYRRALIGANGNGLDEIRRSIFAAVDELPEDHEMRAALNNVYGERARQSQEFFEKHAGKFTEVTDSIAGFEHYSEGINELLATLDLPNTASAMEVGPGAGGFLPALNEKFDSVLALDNSPAMLDMAKEHCEPELQNSIQFILGEPKDALAKNINVDFLAFNMVMHHIPKPADVIQDAAKLLNENGYLLVTDLCPHNQDWVKESCGDIWLGLDPDKIEHWAKQAGLVNKHQVFVGLRNGFQIQIQLFKKLIN